MNFKNYKMTFIVLVFSLFFTGTVFGGQGIENLKTEHVNMIPFEESGITSFNEAPELKEKVNNGELPPLEERLPKNPLVVEPGEEIGEYGGTLYTSSFNEGHLGQTSQILSETPICYNRDLENLTKIPNYIEDWEFSNEGKTFTMNLREGLKWSDGHPVTVEDFFFWFEDIIQNEELTPTIPSWLRPGGNLVEAEEINDYTLKLHFEQPYYGIADYLSYSYGPVDDIFVPAHHLKKYHIEYNSEVNEIADEDGYEDWTQLFELHWNPAHNTPKPEEVPVLSAWKLVDETDTGLIFERNPYYYRVDSAGNQLPYIDRIQTTYVEDTETRKMQVMTGQIDYMGCFLPLSEFPSFKSNEDRGNYNTYLAESLWSSKAVYVFNQNHENKAKEEIYRNKKFRQALSLAIDRKEMQESLFLGQGKTVQVTFHPSVPGYKEEWANSYAEYDPEKAKEMLDEIGLVDSDNDGWRELPNEENFILNLMVNSSRDTAMDSTELVRSYWEDIGVNVNMKPTDERTYWEKWSIGDFEITWTSGAGPTEAGLVANFGDFFSPNEHINENWATWLDHYNVFSETLTEEPPASAEEPPDDIKNLYTWTHKLPYVDNEERVELFQKIGDYHAENLLLVGTVGLVEHVVVVNKDLGNVNIAGDNVTPRAIRNAFLEQSYWKTSERKEK